MILFQDVTTFSGSLLHDSRELTLELGLACQFSLSSWRLRMSSSSLYASGFSYHHKADISSLEIVIQIVLYSVMYGSMIDSRNRL